MKEQSGKPSEGLSVISWGISSSTPNQTASFGLAFADGLIISRYLSPFKSGDFQLMFQLVSFRQESLGVKPSTRVSEMNNRFLVFRRPRREESKRYSRVGASDTSPLSILWRWTGFALVVRWRMWGTHAWTHAWNSFRNALSRTSPSS